MSGRASQRGRFFGRRKPRPVQIERPHWEAEQIPDPMRREDWLRWLELQGELELAEIQDC